MYVEILKIIEAGLDNDKQKVINYSEKLSEILKNKGNEKVSNKIEKLIKSKNTRLSSLDSLTSKPFDQDSKLEMVEVSIPTEDNDSLYFESFIEKEVVSFMESIHSKEEFLEMGLEVENRLLLYGPPGTGKTSLAKYISYHTDLPLITVKLDALISSMLGSTSKNIRKVFDFASKQPCILFLDEFDVLAKVRDDKNELGELKRVVNSLLQNIDSFSSDSILIAATNHEHILDSAVWRRFNTTLQLSLPNEGIRKDIIKEYSNIMENDFVKESKKMNQLSKAMQDMSPADIKNIIQKTIKQAIITKKNKLLYSNLLYQIYITNKLHDSSNEKFVEYLLENKVSQKDISFLLDISLRQVRNIIKGVDNNE
ncbi:AAA family ATPase [Enterococcus sp.]|uniref:AAA family ATPase n=1 Tax=Enterococcus sp. TaxID=35783 RepID=UPI002FC61D58